MNRLRLLIKSVQISRQKAISIGRLILWYLILIIIGFVIVKLQRNYPLPTSDYSNILSILISTIGITTAIIITFLFSKLYSEKTERIARKQKIDKLSKKLTALRKIVHFLRGSHEFWRGNENIKKFLDNKYKDLTLYDYIKKGYEWHVAFHDEVKFGELGAQAYLGLKEIEGNEQSTFAFYDRLLRKNYSIDELAIIQDSCGRMWAYMDKYGDGLKDVSTLSVIRTEPIEENLKIIYPNFKQEDLNNKTIQTLFDDFPQKYIREQYYLTQRNNKSFGRSFNTLLFDLVFFVILIIFGVFLISINIVDYCKMFYTNIIVSGFIITVIDLLVNVIRSIRKELIVSEFYEA